jgi:lipid II:glycine glycyltransferase (peptidoglycan interpeptide bridge formation enzyme)
VYQELDPTCFARKAETAVIDLKPDLDYIFHNVIGSKRRNMIRKALKNNITIDAGGSEIFDRFFAMLQHTFSRTGLNTRPESFYREILDLYYPVQKAVCLIASQEGTDLSGIVIVRNHFISSYWLGVSSGEKLNLGASELLQYEAIQWSRTNGSKYYDLCVIDKKRLPHIARFKSGFSNHMVPFYFTRKKPILYRIMHRMKLI